MIELPKGAEMRGYQEYIHSLEEMHGWLKVNLVENCFLMGEEMGELFKAIRRYKKIFPEGESAEETQAGEADEEARQGVAEELIDVFNYLCAIANRLDIDLEQAFREKNAKNQKRSWG